jgi:hypothetical protein
VLASHICVPRGRWEIQAFSVPNILSITHCINIGGVLVFIVAYGLLRSGSGF